MKKNLLIGLLILALAAACAPPESTPAPASVETQTSPAPDATTAAIPPTASAITVSPSNGLNIVALGDSLTEGQGDEMSIGYPGRIALKMALLNPKALVFNFGKSGWTSADLINGANGEPSELDQALENDPDIALVWIGSNDLWYLYEYGPEPMTAEAEQQDLEQFKTNIETILSKLTLTGARVIIALLDDQSLRPVVADPPNPNEPAFTSITADDLTRMSAHVRAYNTIITLLAQQYNAQTVDFYNTTIFTDASTLAEDGNHPNNAGYDLIAEMWLAALEPLIK
jgi:lysophospholipase L1-like esterase